MGGPIALGNRPVMDIQTNAGRYWRAAVYDTYSGIGWINTHLDSMSLDANDPRLEGSHEYLRVEVTQTVKIYLHDQNILYAHSQPIRFSLPVEVRYGRPPASDAASPAFDVALIRARRPLREGDTYTAVSAISMADEDSLRGDSIRYSDWITTTYLQLPDDLPVRVRNLAKEVTEQYTNPYDKAAAIEKYLRTKIKYNETINPPPAGRDGVDYLLFDRPEGYCNYYASAMVVMARAVGIPARIASGYSLGDYRDGAFHIIESNAHSWVEVYFPSYGWIEFEPTANKPEIELPKKAELVPFNPDLDDAASEARRKGQREKDLEGLGEDVEPGGFAFVRPLWNESLLLALGGSVVALLAVGTLTTTLVKRTRRMARLAPAARVYEQMLERARWLGIHEQRHATPFERAHAIGIALPQAQKETEYMASSYTRERFGARKTDDAERAVLAVAWDKWRAEWWLRLIALMVGRITALSRAAIERGRALVVRRRSLSPTPQTKEE
jgi:transglutaminase-like putative cysteine protease